MKQTQIISIANQKGGVGKTTTTVNLGTALARQGKKVLLIDLDPQANLTMCMGIQKPDTLSITIANIFAELINKQQTLQPKDYMLNVEGCDIVPSSILLANIEPSIINATSRETLLRRFLKQFVGIYDYILIDCMPSLGMLTINAFTASTSVLIPVQVEFLSAKGLELLTQTIMMVKEDLNPTLEFKGILYTMHDQRLKQGKTIFNFINESYGEHVNIFKQSIPKSIKASEPTFVGLSAFKYDPASSVSLAYEALAQEVIAHG